MAKLEFISMLPQLEHTMPIIKAKDYRHNWARKMAEDFKREGSLAKNNVKRNKEIIHTARCPGIINVKNQGWLVRTHQDIEIEVTDDQVIWNTPINDVEVSDGHLEPTVTMHNDFALQKYFDNWPKAAKTTLVKINTPWHIKVPIGYKLIQQHPAYLDTGDFICLPGMYDDETGIPKVNAVLMWFADGKVLIPAGTPIAQMILVKDEEHELSQRTRDEQFFKDYRVSWFAFRQKFDRSYNQIREIWKRYIGK